MKYSPEVQVMSAKSSVNNTANITSYSTLKNTIKMSVHLLTTTPHSPVGTLCMAKYTVPRGTKTVSESPRCFVQASVAQKLDSAIYQINHYPTYKY